MEKIALNIQTQDLLIEIVKEKALGLNKYVIHNGEFRKQIGFNK